jgi:hypothetical protein
MTLAFTTISGASLGVWHSIWTADMVNHNQIIRGSPMGKINAENRGIYQGFLLHKNYKKSQ